MDEIRSFPFSRLISTKIASATLASQAPNARINIGIVRYIVDVDDSVKDSIKVSDKMEASSESKHISNLFRIMIIEEMVIIEMINVSSCG